MEAPILHAVLSVSNKVGIVSLAQGLMDLGITIFSTGGTAAAIRSAGILVTDVSAYTGWPEMMEGRVKTLHPKVHGSILGRLGKDDDVMFASGMVPIGLVVVNLYPFRQTIAKPDCTDEEAVENIDIGGPAMIRSAAKNHERVTVVVDPGDYGRVLHELQGNREIPYRHRRALAKKAFDHTSKYDGMIADYL